MGRKAAAFVAAGALTAGANAESSLAYEKPHGRQGGVKARLPFEVLVTELSLKFINLSADEVDTEIEDAQRRVCECLGLDLCSLWQWSAESPGFLALTHLYRPPGGPPTPDPMDAQEYFPWCLQQLLAGQVICIPSVEDLPAEAARDQDACRHFGIKTALTIPLAAGGGPLIGALSVNDMKKDERVWSDPLVERLQLVAQIFANAITRKRAEQAIKERLQFEQLLTDLSAKFINQPPDQIDSVIDDSLKRLLETLGHDRSALGQFNQDKGHVLATHSCAVPGVEPFPVGVLADDHVPWIVGQVRNGRTLFLKCLPDDLPPEAQKERQLSNAKGIKSTVAIPLSVSGSVLGLLSFTFLKRHCQWPPEVVSRLQTIGEIFANALVRRRSDEAIRAALAENEQLRNRLEQDNVYLREQITLQHHHGRMIGKSRALKQVLSEAERVAGTDTPVLLLGETGTGKELLAQTIHELSGRKDRPLVIVNCASLPATLIESELFGREAGAYTGAVSAQVGRFTIADGSTLFLDEIGEFPIELQAKLLRVLQDGRFERLGSPESLTVNVPTSSLLDLGDSSASPFVPTIRIPADFQQLGNLQFAWVSGPFWTQAEWYGSFIDQRGGASVFFHGSHIDAGYFLTGEHRSYQRRSGVFGPVSVERPLLRRFSARQSCQPLGYGALELTARFAYLDYSDPHTPVGPQGQLVGIELPQATLGVNWYLADRLRVMFNYSYVQPSEPNSGTSSASVFASRLGMYW